MMATVDREDLTETRPGSPLGDPAAGTRLKDGNIGSGDVRSSVSTLARMFETRGDDLDLALMKVIAEGGSPSEWIAGMLRQSIAFLPGAAGEEPEPPRARFLGE